MLNDNSSIYGDRFVLCPGANFTKIVENSNLPIAFQRVFYGVGATVVLETGENTLSNCIRTPNRGLACGVYSAPHDQSSTIIGASNLISPEPVALARTTSVYTLLKAAMEQINMDFFRAGLASVNLGWRPTSSDTLPMIGIETDRKFTCSNRYKAGWTPLLADNFSVFEGFGVAQQE